MVSLTALPSEILCEIFRLISSDPSFSTQERHSVLRDVANTSRQINRTAQAELWSELVIKEHDFHNRLTQLLRTLDERSGVRLFVKSLDTTARRAELRNDANFFLTNSLLSRLHGLGSLSTNAWFVGEDVLKIKSLHTIHLFLPESLDRPSHTSDHASRNFFPNIIQKVLTMQSLRKVTFEESNVVEPDPENKLLLPDYFLSLLPEPDISSALDFTYRKSQSNWAQMIGLLRHFLFATRLVFESMGPNPLPGSGLILTVLSVTHRNHLKSLVLGSPVTNDVTDKITFSADLVRDGTGLPPFLRLTSLGITLDLGTTFVSQLSSLLPPNLRTLQLGFQLRGRKLQDFAEAAKKIQEVLESIQSAAAASEGLYSSLKKIICWTSHENRFEGARAWGQLLKGLTSLWKNFDDMGVDLVWIPGGTRIDQTPLVKQDDAILAGAVDFRSRYKAGKYRKKAKDKK